MGDLPLHTWAICRKLHGRSAIGTVRSAGQPIRAERCHARLLRVGEGCFLSPLAVFMPADALGGVRPKADGERGLDGPAKDALPRGA
jgi:hypothetical protein